MGAIFDGQNWNNIVVILNPENLFHDHSFDGCFRMR